MRRRDFVALIAGAAVWAPSSRAQQSNLPTIGFLSARSADESAHLVDAFRKGLAEHGLREGKDVSVDYSWADGQYDRLTAQATDFVNRQVTVLVAVGGEPSGRAAALATRTIPIVAVFIGDPVANGFVASLNRPGGNITGVSNLNAVIEAKRIGLLRDLVPGMVTAAVLINPKSPTAVSQQKDIEEAARTIGLQVKFLTASNDRNSKRRSKPSSRIGSPHFWCQRTLFLLLRATGLPNWRLKTPYLQYTRSANWSSPAG